jgi:hypothetical protein
VVLLVKEVVGQFKGSCFCPIEELERSFYSLSPSPAAPKPMHESFKYSNTNVYP